MSVEIQNGNVKFINTELPDILELKNITHTFDGKRIIIQDFNLLIENYQNKGQFIVILGISGCVDGETEFFNGFGWKKISDYNNDLVLQYNENGIAELVKPYKYIKIESSELNHIKTKYGIDQCICDYHNVVYIDRRRPDKLLNISGKDLVSRHNKNINGFGGSFITTYYYNGCGINLTDFEIRLMVSIIADGHFPKKLKTNFCIVRLKKQRKITRLIYLLEKCNIKYKMKEEDDGFTILTFYAPRKEKTFTPEFWYNCSNEQLKIITDECLLWDGSKDNIRGGSFSTSNKITADFIQFAFSSVGKRSTINITNRISKKYNSKYKRKSIEYRVIISNNKYVSLISGKKKNISKVKTVDGFKYCFTVQSGMLILRRNEKIFITGNCGKSTILNFIAGLNKPTSGELLFNKEPLNRSFPMVFQKYSNLYWKSVLDNVMFPLKLKGKENKDKALSMIEEVGLQDHIDKYAHEQILSGGQLQRIAIARALIDDPDIILMDEPFGALDIYTRSKMQLLLNKIWEEREVTIIFVTHDIQEAVFLGDDIFIMDANPGRIVSYYKIDFPVHREREIRKDKKFIDYVSEIEDKIFELNTKLKSTKNGV